MAILAVKIDERATLRMNEFFDYSGFCWAVSRKRSEDGAEGADLEDFYEGTVRSSCIEDVPVIFMYENKIVGHRRSLPVYPPSGIISGRKYLCEDAECPSVKTSGPYSDREY